LHLTQFEAFLYGPSQMRERTVFFGFYIIFSWYQQKHKVGVLMYNEQAAVDSQ
jgi:hypothetical protein